MRKYHYFFKIPTVIQTRLLMHGLWIIKWYIKRVCCFCFWEEGKQTVQFARLNIPTFIPHRNKI